MGSQRTGVLLAPGTCLLWCGTGLPHCAMETPSKSGKLRTSPYKASVGLQQGEAQAQIPPEHLALPGELGRERVAEHGGPAEEGRAPCGPVPPAGLWLQHQRGGARHSAP